MPHQDLPGRLATLASLADPTRRALFDYVRGQSHPVGRDEAAEAVGVSRSLAAYHLDRLAESGLLSTRYKRPEGRGGPGAGRPAKLYSREEGAVEASVPPRDYRLAAHVFAEVLAGDATGAVLDAMMPVARRIGRTNAQEASSAAPPEPASTSPAEPALALLSALGYEPYVDEPGTIRLRNCPFHDLVEEHLELACTMNLGLLEGALEEIADAGCRAVLDPGEDRCCVAVLRADVADRRDSNAEDRA